MGKIDIQVPTLKRIIFQLSPETALGIYDIRGKIAEQVKESDIMDKVQFTHDGLIMRKDAKDEYITFSISPNSVDGSAERETIVLSDYDKYFKMVNSTYKSLPVKKILRFGTRFLYAVAINDTGPVVSSIMSLIDKNLRQAVGTDFTDLGLSFVGNSDNLKLRFLMGPLLPKEFANYFERVDLVRLDKAILFDLDLYTFEFNFTSLRLEQWMFDNEKIARKRVESVLKLIGPANA